MSANQPLAQLKALKMEIRAKTLIITALVSLTVLPLKAVENPTASELSDKKHPSAWNLLRKHRQKKLQAAAGGDKQRTPDQAKPGSPTAADLLDKYTRALDSLRSIIVKAEITSEHEYRFDKNYHEPGFRGIRDKGTCYKRTESRTDGQRIHSRRYEWGHISARDPSAPEEQARYNCLNWANMELYQNTAVVNSADPGLVYVHKEPSFRMRGTEPALTGYVMQSDERTDSILRRAESISLRQKTERIASSDCYVMDAKTDTGRISVWIDPAHGYHLANARARATEGDLYWGKPLRKGWVVSNRLENVRFEKVGGIWVPVEADISMENHYGPGSLSTQKSHCKRTEVVVNPDHDGLGSFDNPLENPENDPLLRNGTYVYIQPDRTRYIWQDGRVIDKDGKVIIDSTPKNKSDSKQSQSEIFGKKAASSWDLLREERQKRLQAAGGDKQRASSQARREPATATELLDKLSEALDSAGSTSFIAKGESTQEHEYRFSKNYREPGFRGVRDRGTCYRREEFRTDGERYHLRQYSWGHISPQDSSVPDDRPIFYCLNYAAENELYRHSVRINPGQPGGIVMISKLDSSKTNHMDYRLQGYVLPSHERADLILRRAESISVRPKTEKIGGSECYVIDAKTDCGRVSLWIDPGHGYHLARAEVRATEGDLEYGQRRHAGQVHTIRLESFRFEEVDGVWVPMEADMSSDLDYGGGSFTRSKTHYKRTEIVLNPDHDALGSFENPLENPKNDPELKNGTFVRKDGSRYIWQDGKLVPDKDKPTPRQKRAPKPQPKLARLAQR